MIAAASAAGALLGVLVGGVGGRLAMAVLAAKNPEDAGTLSDDGFTIGQFTLEGTVQLLGATLQAGLIAAMLYLALRPLRIGPSWLRIVCLTLGGVAVGGVVLINPGGVDFAVLDPSGLAVALILAIPAVVVPLFYLLAERWLAPGSWFSTARTGAVASVLLVWILSGPVIVLLAIAYVVGVGWRRASTGLSRQVRSRVAWAGRTLVGLLGVMALVVTVGKVYTVI
jgi:hypothetical protein